MYPEEINPDAFFFLKIISHKYSVFPDAASARQDIFCCSGRSGGSGLHDHLSACLPSHWRLMAAHWMRPSASCFSTKSGSVSPPTPQIGRLVYCLTSSQNFRKHPGSLKYGWFFGGIVFSRSEWFASVTWKLVTPAFSSIGTNTFSSSSITPAFP